MEVDIIKFGSGTSCAFVHEDCFAGGEGVIHDVPFQASAGGVSRLCVPFFRPTSLLGP